MSDYSAIKERLNLMKQAIRLEASGADKYKQIIQAAIKVKYPNIPDNANDRLASKLMHLDNNEVLQMGKEQIVVDDLLLELAFIIENSSFQQQIEQDEDNN